MLQEIKHITRSISNIHRPDGSPNIFLFSMPRSGSTWLMELIWSQPGFKYCDQPLDLRNPLVCQHLGMTEWEEFFGEQAEMLFENYFQAFCDGRLKFMNPNPARRYYRPITHRIIFKIIHGGEDRINWFRDTFNGRIIYLIRHPIAVSLSHEVFPRVPSLLNSSYRLNFKEEQIEFGRDILDSGTNLEKGVLTWCLQNTVPLRDAEDDWIVVSYEQLVVDPEPVIMYLTSKLSLPHPERMMKSLTIPSAVKTKSDKETQKALEDQTKERSWLVEKWRKKISKEEERRCMEIAARFELDHYYEFDNVLPTDRLWIK